MKRLIGLGILGLISLTAIVAQASYSEPYKSVVNGKTAIYIPGQTAGQPANIVSPSTPKAKVITLNNCGIGRISKGTTSPIIDITGSGVNFSSKTSGTKPTCTLDKTSGAYTSSWSATVGSILDDGTAFYIKGGTGAGAITISTINDSKISTKANNCGTIRISVSDTKPMTTFKLNGTDYTLDSLPDKLPEQCKTNVKYLPQQESISSGG